MQTETQAFVVDADPLGLNEEPELQDLNETAENEEPQTPSETMESIIPQNSTETTENEQNEEPLLLTEFETPLDFDSGKVRTVGVAIYSDSSINNPLSSTDWGNL